MTSQADHWEVFFSSCFTDQDNAYLSIRRRVKEAFNLGSDKPVWMGEDFPVLSPISPTLPVDKAMFCVKGVRHCDAYVAVIIDKHGSGIGMGPGDTQASFLELELFEAAISRKPAFVFILKGHEPKGKMAAVLDLLAPALPGLVREPMDEDEILRQLERILYSIRHPWLARLRHVRASSPVASDRLGASRHKPYMPESELPSLQFLAGPYDATLGPPNFGVVERVLATVEGQDDQQSRLALIWIAIRELMGEHLDEVKSDELLYWWDEAYGRWGSASAWYGLHGFCLMGCLGAISTQSRVLRAYSKPQPMPHATFASEYYSIAKKVGDRRLRQIFLDLALAHIDVTLRDQESDGGLAIRGSINWQLGRPDAAIADYERMVTLKEDAGATARDIGWAKAELGFALVHSRSTRSRGMNLLEEGVSSFTGRPDGFSIRAKRKLALGYLKTGSPRRALAELVEAHDLAANASLYDQIGKVEHAAKLVDRMLPFLKNAY